MTIVMQTLRYKIMRLMIFVADRPVSPYSVKFSLDAMDMAGSLDDLGCSWDDAALALREAVAIGHATTQDGWYEPTQAGRDWVAVETAVRQSKVDAAKRAAVAAAEADASHGARATQEVQGE